MALAHIHFYSEVLGLCTSACVILPEKRYADVSKPARLLVLLHGRTDDHTSWIRRTPLERYAEGKNLAVVMPEAGLSYYTDMKHGGKYLSYVGEELPLLARSFFRLSEGRENTYIAGTSMGGYGAFKAALTYPDTFSRAGSFSGALDITGRIRLCDGDKDKNALRMFINCFGDPPKVQGARDDLFHLLGELKKSGKKIPALYQCCGTEDFLYEGNKKFLSYCEKNDIPVTYGESPGTHEWNYWDRKIQDFLRWLP